MGVVRMGENNRSDFEEFKRTLLSCVALQRRKDEEHIKGFRSGKLINREEEDSNKLVCVTSGVSYLGIAIVNSLLLHGYTVRVITENQGEVEKLREMEMMSFGDRIKAVMARLSDVDGLTEAFEGCYGVFHTSAFADPAGISGYSKSMAEIEVKASENVMEACGRVSSVRKCVFTSSLLACIWRDGTVEDLSPLVNQDSWSDESLCTDKKLWYALGKLKAEKAAWRIAKGNSFKLATICPALITGPDFFCKNTTPTIAYLKGAQEMYEGKLLATVDVKRLAKAHVCVFEEMNKTAFGRFICFDHIINRHDEAIRLAEEIRIHASRICGSSFEEEEDMEDTHFQLSNMKLLSLMSRTVSHCYTEI